MSTTFCMGCHELRPAGEGWTEVEGRPNCPDCSVEEFKCPGCDEPCEKNAWLKGKVECCKYCGDCKRYLPAGDWNEVAWDYAEEVGDICPTCSDNWWECGQCQAKWHTDDQDEDYDGENDDNLCPECIKK